MRLELRHADRFKWFCPGCWRWWTGWWILIVMAKIGVLFQMRVIMLSPRADDEYGFPLIWNEAGCWITREQKLEWYALYTSHLLLKMTPEEATRLEARRSLFNKISGEVIA